VPDESGFELVDASQLRASIANGQNEGAPPELNNVRLALLL